MSEAGWLKPHILHIRDCRSVILGPNCVREQELRLALGSVDFDREGDGGADEDTVGPFLSDYQPTLFNAELAAQTCGDDDAPALADLAGFHSISRCPTI